jgi:hypothetical protein
MKKLLALFVLLDLVFVAMVLRLNAPTTSDRGLASSEELSDGQRQKQDLIKSLTLTSSATDFTLRTEYLQSLCASYRNIALKFKAPNMAVSGTPPTFTSAFSCETIQQDSSTDSLKTLFSDFFAAQKKEQTQGYVTAHAVFSDETLEPTWQLFEIEVSGGAEPGAEHFSISEAELLLYLSQAQLSFQVTSDR